MNVTTLNQNCPYCGMIHTSICPRVKSYEYYSDGTVKRVEFFEPKSMSIDEMEKFGKMVIT